MILKPTPEMPEQAH